MACVYKPLHPCLDRLKEAHWFIHQMEEQYHFAERFRYSLNAYIRSLKEVRTMFQQGMQNVEGFKEWYADHKKALDEDPLLSKLGKKRDYLVHHGMLDAKSNAGCGIARGAIVKLAMSWDVHPNEDSDEAMKSFARASIHAGDQFGFFNTDDTTRPCVEREWVMTDISDDNILDVAWAAWMTNARVISEACTWQGGEELDLTLPCRHDSKRIKLKTYDRDEMISYATMSMEGV